MLDYANILTRVVLGLAVLVGPAWLCVCDHAAQAQPVQARHQSQSSCCNPDNPPNETPSDSCPINDDGPDCPHCSGQAQDMSCQADQDPVVLTRDSPSYPLFFALPVESPLAALDFDADRRAFRPIPRSRAYAAPTLRAQRCLSLT